MTDSRIPIAWIVRLFERFQAIYGHSFRSIHRSEREWQLALVEWQDGLQGIDGQTIKEALGAIKRGGSVLPPTLPQFRRLCEQILGIPDEDEVLSRAAKGDFSHPIIKMVAEKIGSWSLRYDDQKTLKAKVAAAYERAMYLYRQGKTAMLTHITPPVERLSPVVELVRLEDKSALKADKPLPAKLILDKIRQELKDKTKEPV